MGDISPDQLPPYLNLPPHLSAHKYFFVCTLTVAAWDTLVLSPRSWKLLKTDGWPALKIAYYFLRFFMPIEFIIVGVAFFDSSWTQAMCRKFFLFEPICTAVLLAVCSAVQTVRIHAIHDRNRNILYGLGSLVAVQIVVTGICCGFYRSVPFEDGQGCIAGPKANWVGIYWLAPTLVYTATMILAIMRSMQSLNVKRISMWKLMLRDGLNLYSAIWALNMVNMIFWFVITPTGIADSIKTIVTSMTAVITTTMTLRIILSVRGGLAYGGSFAGASITNSSSSHSASRGVPSHQRTGTNNPPSVLQINSQMRSAPTYTIGAINQKTEPEWDGADQKSSLHDADKEKETLGREENNNGVKITVDRSINGDN